MRFFGGLLPDNSINVLVLAFLSVPVNNVLPVLHSEGEGEGESQEML